jgi:hypothetical protein
VHCPLAGRRANRGTHPAAQCLVVRVVSDAGGQDQRERRRAQCGDARHLARLPRDVQVAQRLHQRAAERRVDRFRAREETGACRDRHDHRIGG